MAERQLNAEGLRDLSLEAICAPITVESRGDRNGQVTEALAVLSYRMGRYGVYLEEFNELRDGKRGMRLGTNGVREFELVFTMRGAERRVHCAVA